MFVSSRNARQVLKFKIPLSSPLKAIGRYFKGVKPNSLSVEYQQWRDRFLLQRLGLAAWIALIGFSTLSQEQCARNYLTVLGGALL